MVSPLRICAAAIGVIALTAFSPHGAAAPASPQKSPLVQIHEDFAVDLHPDDPRIVIASPCSGHGFKFAPAIGEILADLATEGGTRHDISRFALARFGP